MFDLEVTKDLRYGQDPAHVLDLYRPLTEAPPPVVVYLHGGGFVRGDKGDGAERVASLARHGIAVASANYRLAPGTVYPGQVTDVKTAIAWLRRNAGRLPLNTGKVGLWGASAGGYLAAMAALTAGDPEQTATEDLELSSVDAVVDWFAVSDFRATSARSWLEKMVLPPPFEAALFGVPDPAAAGSLLAEASPVSRVHPGAPPFLIAHGDRDQMVPVRESAALHDTLVRAGVNSTFITLGGAGHEGEQFESPAHLAMTAAFLLGTLA